MTTDTKRAAGGTTDRPLVGIGTKTRTGIARGAKIVIGTIPVVIARRETGAGAAVGAATDPRVALAHQTEKRTATGADTMMMIVDTAKRARRRTATRRRIANMVIRRSTPRATRMRVIVPSPHLHLSCIRLGRQPQSRLPTRSIPRLITLPTISTFVSSCIGPKASTLKICPRPKRTNCLANLRISIMMEISKRDTMKPSSQRTPLINARERSTNGLSRPTQRSSRASIWSALG
mmetsp:Transcript_22557/g.53467  ORF Transcript_22557/g.53467 Transcript_22557/m.53467 type:complete len:234 (+) Transcript_22557:168-869(+)